MRTGHSGRPSMLLIALLQPYKDGSRVGIGASMNLRTMISSIKRVTGLITTHTNPT